MSIIMRTHQNVGNLKRMRDIMQVFNKICTFESTALLKPLKPRSWLLACYANPRSWLLALSQLMKKVSFIPVGMVSTNNQRKIYSDQIYITLVVETIPCYVFD